MAALRRIKLTKLNEHLVCRLCRGYFVEATTISECLHTFCKTCIVSYLETSSFCPVCDVQIHKTKPISGLREDRTLQDVVFKLVPNLFRNEMCRRTHFYKEHPEAGGDRTEQSLKERRHFFHVDDQISLSLEYLPPAHAHAHALGLRPVRAPSFSYSRPPSVAKVRSREEGGGDLDSGEGTRSSSKEGASTGGLESENEDQGEKEVRIPVRRYLKCPAAVQVRLLEKFIRLKYNLSTHHKVDIVHSGDCLSPELTLLDVVYMYKWTEDDPLKLQYTVIAPTPPLRKRPRPAKCKSSSSESSPKKLKSSPIRSPAKDSKQTEEDAKGSPKKAKREREEARSPLPAKRMNQEGEERGGTSPGQSSQSPNSLVLPTDKEVGEEGGKEATSSSTEGLDSLDSSRDEADDAMVIDESASSTALSESPTSPVVAADKDISSDDKETDKDPKTKNSPTVSCTSPLPLAPIVQQEGKAPALNDKTPVAKSGHSPAKTPISAPQSLKSAATPPGIPNSSIESLKALVNKSSYSDFPHKNGNLPPKVATTSHPPAITANSEKNSPSVITSASNKVGNSHTTSMISKTIEKQVSSPARSEIPTWSSKPCTSNSAVRSTVSNPSTSSAAVSSTSITSCTTSEPVRSSIISPSTSSALATSTVSSPSTSSAPVRSTVTSPIKPSISGSLVCQSVSVPTCTVVPTKVSQPKMTNACKVTSHRGSAEAAIALPGSPVPHIQKSSPALKSSRMSHTIGGTPTIAPKPMSEGPKTLVSPSATYSHPVVQKAPIHGSLPTSLPAPTALTPALKTPLSSIPPHMPSASQGINGTQPLAPQINSSLPQGQRLVSNSYRACVQMNRAIRMNGMVPTPRPVMDPTKPRLGRPPNSVRVAAGRMVPQPIVPRGGNPREIYTPKAGTKNEGGRGRPKNQSAAGGHVRGVMSNVIAPRLPVLPVGSGVPLRPNSRPLAMQAPQGHHQGVKKNSELTNGISGISGNGAPVVNGVAAPQGVKSAPHNNQGRNQVPANKLGTSNAINGGTSKEPKRSMSEAMGAPPTQKSYSGGEPPKTSSSLAPPSPHPITTSIAPQQPQGCRPPSQVTSGVKGGTKSPGRSKSLSSGGNPSSILSIVQSLANKQLQQISQNGSPESTMPTLGGTPSVPSTISPASVAAATLGLNPAFCAAVQNLISLNSLSARMNLAMTQVPQGTIEAPLEKGEAGPMDLSPTNKGAPSSAFNTRPLKGQLKGNCSAPVRKSPSGEGFKSPSILSPKGIPTPSSTPPSVPSPKPTQSPSPDSASTPQGTPTISPPTPEVTITKLPVSSAENPPASSSAAPVAPKAAHTNTVSITKRPSVTTSAPVSVVPSGAGPTAGKYLMTRSPSNASVRQIPNPSHLSHTQASASPKSTNPIPSKTPLYPTPLANNNNNNNNNNNSAAKALKVDL